MARIKERTTVPNSTTISVTFSEEDVQTLERVFKSQDHSGIIRHILELIQERRDNDRPN